MNEEINKQDEPSFVVFLEAASRATLTSGRGAQPGMGETGIPFTRNCVLDTTTWSPAFKPEVME